MSVNAGERHIKDTPSNNMFYAVDSAKELAIHTIKICSNTNIFKQDYSMITQEIINNAMTVYRYTWTANHIRADSKNNWIIREKYEKMAKKVLAGEMTKEKVDDCYSAWKDNASFGNSYKLLKRMDDYYERLWREEYGNS